MLRIENPVGNMLTHRSAAGTIRAHPMLAIKTLLKIFGMEN
jgi:hypothetical protein